MVVLCFTLLSYGVLYSKQLIHLKIVDYNIKSSDESINQSNPDLSDTPNPRFENNDPVITNVCIENNQNYQVTFQWKVWWLKPDGSEAESFEATDQLDPGHRTTWHFRLNDYPQCPGNWQVVIKIKEVPTGQNPTIWQTVIEEYYEVVQYPPNVTDLIVSDANPCPGEVIQITTSTLDAAQYNGEWSDNATGILIPPTVTVTDSCPQDRVHHTSYTVPNTPGQSIDITFNAYNSEGSDDERVTIQVKNTYSLTASVNPFGSGTIDLSSVGPYCDGTVVDAVANPNSQDGWEFDEWSEDANGNNPSISVAMDGNKSITANFKKIRVTLSPEVEPPGAGEIIVVPSETIYDWGVSVDVFANNYLNYTFDHWELDLDGDKYDESIYMDGNKTIKAVFRLVNRNLNTNADPPEGGSIILNPDGGVYPHGTTVDLTALENPGWVFNQWSGDNASGSDPNISITIDGNKTITAHFEQIKHSLTVLPSTGGNVVIDPPLTDYLPGTIVDITVEPDAGYCFAQWDLVYDVPIDGNEPNTFEIVMNNNKTIKPNFSICTPTIISLTPASQEVALGGDFTVNLEIDEVSNLYGHEIDIKFDPNNFEVLSVMEGDFLDQNGSDPIYSLPPAIDNENGIISNIVSLRLTPGVGVNGQGVLAIIEFREKSGLVNGYISNIEIIKSDVKLSDPFGGFLPVSKFNNTVVSVFNDHWVSDPNSIIGPAFGIIDYPLIYTVEKAFCNKDHPVEYGFDWGDGTPIVWGNQDASHFYQTPGTYPIRYKDRCIEDPNIISDLSQPFQVEIHDIITDLDNNGKLNLGDLYLFCLEWLEEGSTTSNGWRNGADINRSGIVDLVDYSILVKKWPRKLKHAPIADAGGDVSILEEEQAESILLGVGMDEDEEVLSYRWYKGKEPWRKTYGGVDYDEGLEVIKTSDGGYAFVGYSNSSGAGSYDVYVVKMNRDGVLEWEKTYGGSGDDRGVSIQETADSGFIIGAWTKSFGAGGRDFYLLKTNAGGILEWSNTFGGGNSDTAMSAIETFEGGYLIVGQTGASVYVVKTNCNGNEEWHETYPVGTNTYSQANAIQQTSDGGYILAGHTGLGYSNAFLIRIDSIGTSIWEKTISRNYRDTFYSVQISDDGGYFMVGDSGGTFVRDLFVMKTDMTGNVEWERFFDKGNDDRGHSGVVTTDGGYIASGWTDNNGSGPYDMYVVKMNMNGVMEWEMNIGGDNEDRGRSIIESAPDVYVVGGFTHSYGAGSSDYYLVKLGYDIGNVLLDWTQVGLGSEAYLDLGSLASFEIGKHKLVLQVSDGAYIVTDDMELTVDQNVGVEFESSLRAEDINSGIHK